MCWRGLVDLTWCEGSTAHGGEVWPHHIIISTLFVTAVFTVQTWWLGKCVLFRHVSIHHFRVLRGDWQVNRWFENCLRPHQWTSYLRNLSPSLYFFYFHLRSFQTDDNIEFSVVCKYLLYDCNQQYMCQNKWQDREHTDPHTEWIDQVTVVQCCL